MNLLNIFTISLYNLGNLLTQVALHIRKIDNRIIIHKTSFLNSFSSILKDNCLIRIGEQSHVSGKLIFDKENASITIGNRVFMNGTLIAAQRIELGDDILIAWGVTIVDHDSHSSSFSKRSEDVIRWKKGSKDWTHVKISPVKICNKVWIGFNSIILNGVTIGEGAVVGAGSVVTKDVPPWTIVAGNPARIIREIPENER
jgi:acetyltransferase-like isoleucine patch superfamily enzyme